MQLYTLVLLSALAMPAAASAPVVLPTPTAAPTPASLAPSGVLWPTACRVTGVAKLKATGMGIPYNNNFSLSYDLKIHLDPATGKASVDVSYQGHSTSVKGMLVNDTLIQLTLNQSVPQNFQGDGFSASLTGIIKSGFLTCVDSKVHMLIRVDATGDILWNGITVPVTGKVETDTHN